MITKCAFCEKEINRIPSRALKKRCFCCTSHQIKYEYMVGIRDKNKITQKANEHVRKYGNPKLIGRKHTEEHKQKIRNGCKGTNQGKDNGMYGKTPWNKMTPTKKWWEEKEFIKLRKECLKRDNYKCVCCGVYQEEKNLYCDHIVPYRICEEHKINNLQMLCGSCHSKKTVKDYHKYKGFYKRISCELNNS